MTDGGYEPPIPICQDHREGSSPREKKKTSLLAATMNVKPVETGGPKIGAKIDMALDEIVKAGDFPLR